VVKHALTLANEGTISTEGGLNTGGSEEEKKRDKSKGEGDTKGIKVEKLSSSRAFFRTDQKQRGHASTAGYGWKNSIIFYSGKGMGCGGGGKITQNLWYNDHEMLHQKKQRSQRKGKENSDQKGKVKGGGAKVNQKKACATANCQELATFFRKEGKTGGRGLSSHLRK